MNEQSPLSPAADVAPRVPARRGGRLATVAAAAAALALVGGVAGAVAAVVSHGSSTPAGSAGGGATLFFPAVGQAAGGGGGVTGATAESFGASGGGVMGAPAMALDQRGAGAPGVAAATVSPGFAYPSYGCGSPAPVQVQGDGITASAMVQVPLGGGAGSTYTLNVGVQSQNGDDVKAALAAVRSRLDAIRAALHRAGIADAQISQQNVNVWASGGPKPVSSGVNAGLTVSISDASLVDPAITAAADAGASNLNLWSSGGATGATPSDAQVRGAITKATAQARSMAQAEADGLGLQLGAVRASTVQPPSICPWAQGGPQLVVAVSVTYAVK